MSNLAELRAEVKQLREEVQRRRAYIMRQRQQIADMNSQHMHDLKVVREETIVECENNRWARDADEY